MVTGICLQRGANDLHVVQLMPVPLIICKVQQSSLFLLSGTTRVSRCQKRTSGLYGARED